MLRLLDSNAIALQSYSSCFEVANHKNERVIKKGIAGPFITVSQSICLWNAKEANRQHDSYCSSIYFKIIYHKWLRVVPCTSVVINQKKRSIKIKSVQDKRLSKNQKILILYRNFTFNACWKTSHFH